MDIDIAICTIEDRYDFKFKDKQTDAIKSILKRKDTFIVLPTGYGKTKIYAHLPELYELVENVKGTILVISPLQSLMLDQVAKLEQIGIKATVVGECQNDKSVADKITEGVFPIVFSSPEAALTPGFWRRCFASGAFHDNLQAVIVDEAHCITQWGGEFRQEYGKLAQLRSIFPDNTTFVALTATATKAMRIEILKKLDMIDDKTVTIYKLPERKNITYVVKKTKKSLHQIQWVLNDLVENGKSAKKTVIYCRNISSCADLYEHFNLHIKQSENLEDRLFAMFHRSTASLNKEHVLSEFPKTDSVLRIVFATIAFGMGVDIPDVDHVIHWGAPCGLEQFAQESGRAGRDGRQSTSYIYFSGHDIAKDRSTTEMRDFCNATDCLRDVLKNHFRLGKDTEKEPTSQTLTLCKCCSSCIARCKCGMCVQIESSIKPFNEMPVLDSNDTSVRYLSDGHTQLLKDNLLDFREILIEEGSKNLDAYDDNIIDSIVKNSDYIMCKEDIIELGLLDHNLAEEIILLIEEISEYVFK